MMVSIDRAGRVVIPKDIRDRLSIEADASLEIAIDGGEIRLTPVRMRSRTVTVGADGLPVIDAREGYSVTDADVQRWRDDQR